MGSNRLCSVQGCENTVNAHDFCVKHYKRYKKYGDPNKLLITPRNLIKHCAVDGCTRKFHAKIYCNIHYYSFKKYGDPLYIYASSSNLTDAERLERRKIARTKYKKSEKGKRSEIRYKTSATGRAAKERQVKKRRAQIKVATPRWANKEKINYIYSECPAGYHVDHIVPLLGKNVCGLHVEYNLRYVEVAINLNKGNKLEAITEI